MGCNQASASMQSQCCKDASHTVLIEMMVSPHSGATLFVLTVSIDTIIAGVIAALTLR